MKSIIILFLSFSIIFCKTSKEMMKDFTKCAKAQIGMPFVNYDARGPKEFSNTGLVWYCRALAGLSTKGPIYVSWKKVEKPKIGCHVYGIVKDKGASVDTENLGVIIAVNPTIIVQGDESKGILISKQFIEDPKYVRTEYIYLDR